MLSESLSRVSAASSHLKNHTLRKIPRALQHHAAAGGIFYLFLFGAFRLHTCPNTSNPTSISAGKTIAESIPTRRLPPNAPETKPARVGPPAQPTSPANASIANSAVPPYGMVTAALLYVPGQRIPTEKPHTAQPSRPATGDGIRTITR